MKKILIRQYHSADYPEIQKILEEAGMYHPPMDNQKNINNKHQKDPSSIIVAEIDKKIAGIILVMTDGWGSFLYRFAVKKAFRNKGIGTKLLEKAEKLLKKRGMQQVNIWVNPKDKKLTGYYSKRGYISITIRLLMVKKL